MPDPRSTFERRAFLQRLAATVALGTAGVTSSVRDLIDRLWSQDRPLLNEANFNSHVQAVRARGAAAEQEFVAAMRSDVRAVLRGRFALTRVQERAIAAFTPTDLTTIVSAVDKGFTGRNEFRLRIVAPTGAPRANCALSAERALKQLPGGATAEVWAVVVKQ